MGVGLFKIILKLSSAKYLTDKGFKIEVVGEQEKISKDDKEDIVSILKQMTDEKID